MSPNIPALFLEGFKSAENSKVIRPHFRAGFEFYPHKNDPVFGERKTDSIIFNWNKDETRGTVSGYFER
jgi:hypothetical protein